MIGASGPRLHRSASRRSSRSSTRRRGELRSHVSELLTASAPSLGDQIKRELHQSIVEVGTKICADVTELEREVCRIRRELSQSAESVGLRIAAAGTHPFSNWKDQIALPRRTLREHRRGAAAAGAIAADLRAAHPRRGARQAEHHRAAERGAVLPAAPAGALDQLAVLAGTRHRPEVVPDDGLPPLSAQRHPGPVRLVERVRGVPRHARRAALHRRREEGVVGSAAASGLRHAGVPHLRRADRRRASRSRSPRSRRRWSSSCIGCAAATSGSGSIRGRWSKRTSGARRATGSTAG